MVSVCATSTPLSSSAPALSRGPPIPADHAKTIPRQPSPAQNTPSPAQTETHNHAPPDTHARHAPSSPPPNVSITPATYKKYPGNPCSTKKLCICAPPRKCASLG